MNGFVSVKEWITKQLKGKSKADGIVLILIGMLVLVVMIPTGSKTGSGEEPKQDKTSLHESTENMQTDSAYVAELEKQVQKLLESMEGVGKTCVMLTLSDDGLTHLDKDVRIQEKTKEETTVIYDMGDTNEPYVIQKERPKIEGVVVVAQGGDIPGVITEITDAMQSLFDLEMHKVKVVKMSVQEE